MVWMVIIVQNYSILLKSFQFDKNVTSKTGFIISDFRFFISEKTVVLWIKMINNEEPYQILKL